MNPITYDPTSHSLHTFTGSQSLQFDSLLETGYAYKAPELVSLASYSHRFTLNGNQLANHDRRTCRRRYCGAQISRTRNRRIRGSRFSAKFLQQLNRIMYLRDTNRVYLISPSTCEAHEAQNPKDMKRCITLSRSKRKANGIEEEVETCV